jgi:hypothetical protein
LDATPNMKITKAKVQQSTTAKKGKGRNSSNPSQERTVLSRRAVKVTSRLLLTALISEYYKYFEVLKESKR